MVQISRNFQNCFVYVNSKLPKEIQLSLTLVGVTPPQLLALYATCYFSLGSPDSSLVLVIQVKLVPQSIKE